MPSSILIITQLFIYPVKSVSGIALDKAELTRFGLKHDRQWMVVRPDGQFVTQRELPGLARVQTSLVEDGVELSMPGSGKITISGSTKKGAPVDSNVWKDACKTIDQGDEISQWLTRALKSNSPLRLVAMKPGFNRSLKKSDLLGNDTSTLFADAAPFLVANQGSLDALNTVLNSRQLNPVPMNRFRPNIVVKGLDAFAEHSLQEISCSTYTLSMCYPCERCVVTTIDQATGQKDPRMQPFKTLVELNPMPGKKRAPAFAENTVLTQGEGQTIAVGDRPQAHYR